jgi:hypothetical protein
MVSIQVETVEEGLVVDAAHVMVQKIFHDMVRGHGKPVWRSTLKGSEHALFGGQWHGTISFIVSGLFPKPGFNRHSPA